MRDSLFSYKTYLAVLIVLLLAYPAVAVYEEKDEPFFFFTWFVFSRVPAPVQTSPEIRLLSVGGKNLPAPVSLLDAKGTLTQPGIPSPEFMRRTEAFASALKEGEDSSTARALVESLIIDPTASYELIELTYSPIAYWKTGAIMSERRIASFTKAHE